MGKSPRFLDSRPSVSYYSTITNLLASICLFLLWGSCGCNAQSSNPGLVYVSGIVRFNGQPLEDGIIGFSSLDGRQLYASRITKGEYVLKESQSVNGVPPGEYRVSVQSWKTLPQMGEEGANDSKGAEGVPVKYFAPDTSGLTATVPSKKTTIHFDLVP